MAYINMGKTDDRCVFCEALAREDGPENLIVHRGAQAFVILNRYPYTSGHLMVLPYEHKRTLDALTPEVRQEMMELTTRVTEVVGKVYRPQGFNIGINQGAAAGAGIEAHIHIHVVPRWEGDTNFMTAAGGTRVLPEALEVTWQRVKDAWDT